MTTPLRIGTVIKNMSNKIGSESSIDPRNKLNELTAKEWIPETISVWTRKGLGAKHPDTKIERHRSMGGIYDRGLGE
jgi:hypothetical protein